MHFGVCLHTSGSCEITVYGRCFMLSGVLIVPGVSAHFRALFQCSGFTETPFSTIFDHCRPLSTISTKMSVIFYHLRPFATIFMAICQCSGPSALYFRAHWSMCLRAFHLLWGATCSLGLSNFRVYHTSGCTILQGLHLHWSMYFRVHHRSSGPSFALWPS